MEHFVYVNGLVGLKTNVRHFRWSFGSDAPPAAEEDYLRCRFKLVLESVPDRDVFSEEELERRDGRFRYFYANRDGMELLCSRRLPGGVKLRYSIRIDDDTIYARVGRTYLKAVRLKVMNLHPISYILYELMNALLLRQGYAVLYGSAFTLGEAAALVMAPPNAGKTFTAVQLAERCGAELLGEDICVFDGEKLYPVPWTNTYRGGKNRKGQAPAMVFRTTPAAATHLFFLDRGSGTVPVDRAEAGRRARLLNRYDLRWYCSPALLALCYFNRDLSLDELLEREAGLLNALLQRTAAAVVSAYSPADFAELVFKRLAGEKQNAPAEGSASHSSVL